MLRGAGTVVMAILIVRVRPCCHHDDDGGSSSRYGSSLRYAVHLSSDP